MKRDERLGPRRRIKKRERFLYIQEHGQKCFSQNFLLIYLTPEIKDKTAKVEPAPESRIGITITTKVHKRAVRRNKLKRRIREIFRRIRPELTRVADVVIIARNGSTELSYDEVKRELEGMFRRARLWRGQTANKQGQRTSADQ